MTDERPPCPKCQREMNPFAVEVSGMRWWTCPCHRKTYLIRRDGWIVVTTGAEESR